MTQQVVVLGQRIYSSPGLIVRDNAASVGEYIGNYICKRCVALSSTAKPCFLHLPQLWHCLVGSGRLTSSFPSSINDFKPTPEKPFVLGLPTGSSPIPTYKHLIKLVKDGKLSYVVPAAMKRRIRADANHAHRSQLQKCRHVQHG